MRVVSAFALFVALLTAVPVAAQPFDISEVYFNFAGGPAGEGVDVRLPRYELPPGLDTSGYVIRPVIKLRLEVEDVEGNIIATDDVEYPSTGLTLKFTTGNIGSGYAALLLNGEPTGGELAVDVNGRFEYTAQLILNPAVEENGRTLTPGADIVFVPDVISTVVYSLQVGNTRAIIKVRPLKSLKEGLN